MEIFIMNEKVASWRVMNVSCDGYLCVCVSTNAAFIKGILGPLLVGWKIYSLFTHNLQKHTSLFLY